MKEIDYPIDGPAPDEAGSTRSAGLARLARPFYDRDTVTVARELLGKYLVHAAPGWMRVGRIVEVEAYLGPGDRAAHSWRGPTRRTRVMFGPPGHAYVYLVYGMHYCMNVVTEAEGSGTAVLLRAVEPIVGMSGRTQGPGLLCRAMGIGLHFNGHDLLSDTLYVAQRSDARSVSIVRRPRIGVDYAGAWARRLLRFYEKDNLYISRR